MALDSAALCDTGMCRTRGSKGKDIQVPRRGGMQHRRKIQNKEAGRIQGGMESKELKWLQPTAGMTSRSFRLYCAMDVKAARFPFSRSCSATIPTRVERGRASVRQNKEIQRGVS